MCGIAGIIGRAPGGREVGNDRAPLAILAHRGPDDSGWVAHDAHAQHNAVHTLLLHRRLSILDLSDAGHQPMVSKDGRHTIVFNGEIYNYCELRDELQHLGVAFHTGTDTEVLLQAYRTWGSECLRKLIGMFALAIRDDERRVLFLARDFFGMKPLYYVARPDTFAFASEIKALLDWLPIQRTVNSQRLYEYLRWGCTDHGAETLWSEIRQVPAAHYLEVPLATFSSPLPPGTGPGVAPIRYWNLPKDQIDDISFEEAADRVREIFLQNVALHLRSDVPVGAALSGGIDSSSIVAAMRVVEPGAEIHAFSFIADDAGLSEERWVDLVAAQARSVVHKIYAEPDQLRADLDDLIYTQDEPFGSTSMYAQYCVFRAAKRHGITVMLDGQGADEMLAGYGQYGPARLSALVQRGHLIDAIRFANNASELSGGRLKLWLQAVRLLLPAIGRRLVERWLMPGWLNARWFYDRGVDMNPATAPKQLVGLQSELRHTIAATSLPQLLRYEDRNSMASSIESRLPFLTPAFAEFVLRLPEEYILGNDGTTKNVFRQAMRGIVPDAILDRRDKIGFATPESRWLTVLRPWVEQALASETARGIHALDVPALQRDWQAVLDGTSSFDFRIWRWVNLIRWVERFNVDLES